MCFAIVTQLNESSQIISFAFRVGVTLVFGLMQRKLLSSYEINAEAKKHGGLNSSLKNDHQPKNVA